MNAAPSRIAEKIVVRLPDGMRERIQRSAKRNARSANAEVVFHLERIFGASASAGPEFGDDSPADESNSAALASSVSINQGSKDAPDEYLNI